MPDVYPALTQNPVSLGFQESPYAIDPTVRDNPDDGFVFVRRRTIDEKEFFIFSYENLTDANFALLMTFYRANYALSFIWPNPSDNMVYEVIFAAPIEFARAKSLDVLWNVTIVLEQVGYTEYVMNPGDYGEGAYGSGDYGF